MQPNLSNWPNLRRLLDGYIARLKRLPRPEVEKTWLYRAACNAAGRRELAQLLAALEAAAQQCDENACRTLRKKFADVLPRRLRTTCLQENNGLLDLLVELAAYGWLRRQYPGGKLEFVSHGDKQTPDLCLRLGDNVTAIECKDIHWLSGTQKGQYGERGFHDKVEHVIADALRQLQGYKYKMVFLNYTPSFQLWAEEEVPVEGEIGQRRLESEFACVAPTGALLVVFQNYDWQQPRFQFGRLDP